MAAMSLNSNYRPQFRLTEKTSKEKICAQEVTKLENEKTCCDRLFLLP